MKVIILAAGMGSRLVPYDDLPKCLALLKNNQTILERQLEFLTKLVALSDILVIVGYKKEMIEQCNPDLLTKASLHYASQNTAKSLLLGIEGIDDDLLWLNGDVVFQFEVLEKLAHSKKTAMIVNKEPTGPEEVKYRTNEKGCIIDVSKEVDRAEGEALGINLFKQADLSLLRNGLEKCKEMDFFEKGIEFAIQKGCEVYPIVVNANSCIEVDFPEDLKKANKLFF